MLVTNISKKPDSSEARTGVWGLAPMNSGRVVGLMLHVSSIGTVRGRLLDMS